MQQRLRSDAGASRYAFPTKTLGTRKWLQSTLGSEYRVHTSYNVYNHKHIDTTRIQNRVRVECE
jgi:hypothetical protein